MTRSIQMESALGWRHRSVFNILLPISCWTVNNTSLLCFFLASNVFCKCNFCSSKGLFLWVEDSYSEMFRVHPSSEPVKCVEMWNQTHFFLIFSSSLLLFFSLLHLFSSCLQVDTPLFCQAFIIFYSFSFSVSDTFLSHSFILGLPEALNCFVSHVHEEESCNLNCSLQPPCTNKTHLHFLSSSENKWIDDNILPRRSFFSSFLYGGHLGNTLPL